MHAEGSAGGPSNLRAPMPATDDEIREKYLERAIRELNALTRELQSCRLCPRGIFSFRKRPMTSPWWAVLTSSPTMTLTP